MQTENCSQISIKKEMEKSYLDYAMSVIIGRALPDVRDGLKPVHRRILYAMRVLKNDWNKPYKKSARIVGDVIGKYHPHGDSAVYDTIVRMAQDFSLRYPLIKGQGNFGSIDGDPPAAMRYTEVRMMQIAHELMEDIDKQTVDFVPNYDESLTEPSVLPAKVPSLLINGSSGIAVGMATNIPPHNFSEITDAVIAVIDNKDISFKELITHVPGPDFPTAGMIYGINGIYDAYKTGRGTIRLRANTTIEKNEKTGVETIVVDELPYQVNKAKVVEKVADLIKNKQIDGLRYVRDESDRDGMRIAFCLKKGQMSEVIINQLYKYTRMEVSFGIIFLAIVNNQPKLLNLKEIITLFIIHRKEIVKRRTIYDLNKAMERAHLLEGLTIALNNLDAVVALIRHSKSPGEAKSGLIDKFSLTPIQAQAVLDMRLQRLTGLEQQKIITEYENILKDIEMFKKILGSEQVILNIIKDELLEMKKQYGDKRRTRIVESTQEITMEDLIVEEDMVITISKAGYIKRNPINSYQNQGRGGKGKIAMGIKEEDFVEHLFVASTHHTFLFFTNKGKVYWLKVYDIPLASRISKGKAIINLLSIEKDEKLTTILPVPEFKPGYSIIMATKNGTVKKTDLMAYSHQRRGGTFALTLAPSDELISARVAYGDMSVFMTSGNGKSIRFLDSNIRSTGRRAMGVRGIRLDPGDHIVGMEVLSHGKTLFVATENGYGKRTSLEEYPLQRRGGKGVITIKTSDRNGFVVATLLVEEDDDLMIVTNSGKLIRMSINTISIISRNTQGVKLIDISPGEKVIGAARLFEKEE